MGWMGWMDGWLSLEGAIYRAPTVLIKNYKSHIQSFQLSTVVGALGRTMDPAAKLVEEAQKLEPGETIGFCFYFFQVLHKSNTFLRGDRLQWKLFPRHYLQRPVLW